MTNEPARGESIDPYAMPTDAIAEPPASLWTALRKIGPGIILAGSIVGSGELLLTTSIGARYGFTFLWLILFSCVIKVFVQIELGRYAISSGKPTLGALHEFPGPRLGTSWQVWWWFFMLLGTVSQLGAMCGVVGQAMNLGFPAVSTRLALWSGSIDSSLMGYLNANPECPWAVLTALLAIVLLLSGGYRRIETITTFLIAFVTAITLACVLALPATGFPIHWSDLKEGMMIRLDLPAVAIAAAFSCFGITGVGASELYAYPYWCLEKGYARFVGPRTDSPDWARRARGWIRVMYLDAWASMIVFTIATVAFYFLGATVLYRKQLNPQGAGMVEALSAMYIETFGAWTRTLFLIGVFAVLFKTLYVASASHSRLTTDFLSMLGLTRYPNAEARNRWIRGFCVFYPLLALVLYLWFREPKGMVVFGGFVQAATLPIISGAAVYLRYRRTDPQVRPSVLSDVLLWIALVSICVVAGYSIRSWFLQNIYPLLWPGSR